MVLTLQLKDEDWLMGLKMIQLFVLCKKHTSQINTQTEGKRIESHIISKWNPKAT
jgi:hypothetical protein